MLGDPKPVRRKKQQRHKKSILQKDGTYCFLCRLLHPEQVPKHASHTHHIFFGTGQRSKSEAEGLTVRLCLDHHEYGREAVHMNRNISRTLQTIAQVEWEHQPGHSHADWMALMGKSYREMDMIYLYGNMAHCIDCLYRDTDKRGAYCAMERPDKNCIHYGGERNPEKEKKNE